MADARPIACFLFEQPNRVEVLPNGLAGIPEGLKRIRNGEVSGTKLVVRVEETP